MEDHVQSDTQPLPAPPDASGEAQVAVLSDVFPAHVAVGPTRPQAGRGESVVAVLREILETVIFALLVFLIVQAISRNYRVQSISMQPNLYEGQYLVVNRVVYMNGPLVDALKRTIGSFDLGRKTLNSLFHRPQRGEVIVFVPVSNTKPDLIKRVIGVEGDKVELRQGVVYINDHPLDEPYIRPAPGQSYGPVIVGKDQLFVMGDNRGNSSDSRVFGMLPMKHVIGRALLRYWPPRDWGLIQHYDLKKQLP